MSQTIPSPDGQPTLVTFPAPTLVGGTSPVTIGCAPESGTLFPVGASTVACTGTDAKQQIGSCTFTVSVTPAPPKLAATRFVAFGNSITEGKNAFGAIDPAHTYPEDLRVMLASRYTAQMIFMVNEGCGGERAVAGGGPPCTGGVVRLPGVLSKDGPDVLLLEEGVNDLSGGDPAAIAPMIDAVRSMVREAKGRGITVFLATLLPERAGGSRAGALPLIPAANAELRLLAVSEGAKLVDLYEGFGGSPGPYIDVDGLHPNEAGYQKIAQLYFDAIRGSLELPQGAEPPIQFVQNLPFARFR